MPESQLQTLVILAAAVAILLLLCLLALLRISWRLARLQKAWSGQGEGGKADEKSSSDGAVELSGAFGKFISERPELVVAPKSEQFAAYRKWRKEQGLNWEGR
ncbi:hypothetical protein [Luteolibacter sp. LG18]|uniref:hypothetical protein n=1 Tax=Luteolibacter sp. LG18 TaxID=2819286 RepID=UPI002B2F6C9C|nr:hypothetical protein llg_05140 [Luteolibacter sp. LG18]